MNIQDQTNLKSLPNEILCIIFMQLCNRDWYATRLTCSRFNNLTTESELHTRFKHIYVEETLLPIWNSTNLVQKVTIIYCNREKLQKEIITKLVRSFPNTTHIHRLGPRTNLEQQNIGNIETEGIDEVIISKFPEYISTLHHTHWPFVYRWMTNKRVKKSTIIFSAFQPSLLNPRIKQRCNFVLACWTNCLEHRKQLWALYFKHAFIDYQTFERVLRNSKRRGFLLGMDLNYSQHTNVIKSLFLYDGIQLQVNLIPLK